jgi:hypothetical protein
MKKQVTYNQLFAMDQELIRFQKQFPAVAILLETRLRFFYERADIHLKAMLNGMNDIQKKFVQVDENGKFRTEGEGDKTDWLFVPVYTDFKTASIISDKATIKKLFEEKVTEFMSITITLDI